jgi:CubicO group peptidase (beta-lactamase class C family)
VTTAIDNLPPGAGERISALLDRSVPDVAPAVAISVWSRGEPVYEAAIGTMDRVDAAQPLSLDARFDLASLTKLFTATAFLRFVSDGRVGLDDLLVALVPEFGVHAPRSVDGGQEPLTRRMLPIPPERLGWTVDPSEVTFRQLLAHTSGLAPWRSVFQAAGPLPPPPTEPDPVTIEARWQRGLDAVFGYPFVDRPGRSIRYSDLGFMMLGLAVARLSDLPLATAIRAHVIAPLGLDSVTFTPLRSGVPRTSVVPTSIDELWRMRRCWGEVEDENCAGLGGVGGHAGLFATARDVARFGQAWLDGGTTLGIRDELCREAVSEQAADTDDRRGLGWQLSKARGDELFAGLAAESFGHTGFTGTSLVIDPTRALVVALLTNRVYAGRTHEGIDELRRSLHSLLAEAL